MSTRAHRRSRSVFFGVLSGLAVGWVVPSFIWMLRLVVIGPAEPALILGDLRDNGSLYLYLTLLCACVFSMYGYFESDRRWNEEERRRLELHMDFLAGQSMTDDVTGLYNHRHILEELQKEIERSRRHGRGICGIMVDLDDFKSVNDTYGHLVGDLLLKEFARTLNEAVRSIDIVGRYGGDEFLLLLPETTAASAIEVAERVRSRIQSTAFVRGRVPGGVRVTASLGLFAYQTLEELDAGRFVERADQAMMSAKRSGKDRVIFFPQSQGPSTIGPVGPSGD
ncbi:MAG: hypothetical protein MOGMAGMI_01599 [Candidatus Omnitrophica bacterium]|nr:hypothetical protein [Candidatus Omnitrophota bacterium]